MKTLLFLPSILFGFCSPAAEAREEFFPVLTADHLALTGVLTIPEGELRGSVVILQGSGNVDFEGDVSGPFTGSGHRGSPAKLSRQIAAGLADVGIASLRYSKRGFENPTELSHQTMPYLISDALAAADQMRNRYPELKFGWIGLSEGALIATHAAAKAPVDALFLLSLPTRSIDEVLSYQFTQWPMELLRSKLDADQSGTLDSVELAMLRKDFRLPFLGLAASDLDSNQDGQVSLETEMGPAYQKFFVGAMQLMKTAPYTDWYQGLKSITPFSEVAPRVKAPVYLYQADRDAQVYRHWIESDRFYFGGKTTLRRFSGLGHCFSPFEGEIEEVKTSGPLDNGLLSLLKKDVRGFFKSPQERI